MIDVRRRGSKWVVLEVLQTERVISTHVSRDAAAASANNLIRAELK